MFFIKSNLSTIKNKNICEEILKTVTEDNILTFKITNSKITIAPANENNFFDVYHYEDEIDWKTPAMRMNLNDTIHELYKNRKYYNALWKD